jgi:hypothetical protein
MQNKTLVADQLIFTLPDSTADACKQSLAGFFLKRFFASRVVKYFLKLLQAIESWRVW